MVVHGWGDEPLRRKKYATEEASALSDFIKQEKLHTYLLIHLCTRSQLPFTAPHHHHHSPPI